MTQTAQPSRQGLGPGRAGWDAVQLHPDDNVAVALRDLAAGDEALVRSTAGPMKVIAVSAIAMGHKVAIRSLLSGTAITKYGETIGRLTSAVEIGDHVHVHNLVSCRACS
jgi:altronate dehydratase small subunit